MRSLLVRAVYRLGGCLVSCSIGGAHRVLSSSTVWRWASMIQAAGRPERGSDMLALRLPRAEFSGRQQRIEVSPTRMCGVAHLALLPEKIAALLARRSRGCANAPKDHIARLAARLLLPRSQTTQSSRVAKRKVLGACGEFEVCPRHTLALGSHRATTSRFTEKISVVILEFY